MSQFAYVTVTIVHVTSVKLCLLANNVDSSYVCEHHGYFGITSLRSNNPTDSCNFFTVGF